MSKDNESIEINIPVFEILLVIGIALIIIGLLAPMQLIEFCGIKLWFDPNLWILCIPGAGMVFGYITKKILPDKKGAYWIGFFLSVLGLIIAICIRPSQNNKSNKYENLQILAELKKDGTLTEAEFETEKEKILKGE